MPGVIGLLARDGGGGGRRWFFAFHDCSVGVNVGGLSWGLCMVRRAVALRDRARLRGPTSSAGMLVFLRLFELVDQAEFVWERRKSVARPGGGGLKGRVGGSY